MVAPNTEVAKYPSAVEAGNTDSSAFDAVVKTQSKPVGSSGTEVFSGYFSEEYLTQLRGKRGAKVWDEMRRSESQVAMLLNAIMNPIKAANWDFEPAVDVPDAEKHVELCNAAFKEMIDWETFLHESLTFVPFGFSLFELIHNVVFDHPKLGTINGLKAIAFRSQKTVERWNLEKQTGKLLSVEQYVYSDIGNNAVIPGEFLLVFSLAKEGDNYEGISALRPMYGAWYRKNLYLKLAAIGVEKYAIGTPIGTIPKGKNTSEDVTEFKNILNAYTSHEAAYITKPEGWEIEIAKFDFDAEKIKELILLENTEMINSVVANFLALGMNGSGGAYALGTDLSDFFLSGIQGYANLICGVLNRRAIPDLVKLNYGPQSAYPKLRCTGINDKAGKELAEIVKSYIDANAIKPDGLLEEFLRKQYKLPPADPTTAREKPAPVLPGQNPNDTQGAKKPDDEEAEHMDAEDMPEKEEEQTELSEARLQLDEKYRKHFDEKKAQVKSLMQENLRSMLQGMLKSAEKKLRAAKPSQRLAIAKELGASGVGAYKTALRELLAEIANGALESARKDVPKAKKVKLSESIQLAAPRGGYFEALAPKIKKIVSAQASLIADTQAADLEKIVLFQFSSSVNSTEDVATILNDISEAAEPTLAGSTRAGMSIEAAASNAVANVSNQARLEFFFEPEVLDEIESFTFVNEDPVSDICQELAGTTFSTGDPELDRYSPPLHHNCKSRLVPNLKGDKGNPAPNRGGLDLSRKALDSITLCEPCYHVDFFDAAQK